MNHILLSLLISLLFPLSLSAETIQPKNPEYLVNKLMESPTEESMIETCLYYGMEELPAVDGYRVFRYHDGTIFRFKFEDNGLGRQTPTVEMQTRLKPKEIEKILTKTGYTKSGNTYKKGSNHALSQIVCTLSSSYPTLLHCTKISNNR